MTYAIAEDGDAYQLPTCVVAAVAAAYGVAAWRRQAPRVAVGIALLVPLVAVAANYPFTNRRSYFIAHDYGTNLLRSVEPGGLVLTLDWQVFAPLLYLRAIEQLRPDVTVVDVNLLRRSWYAEQLGRAALDPLGQNDADIDAYLDDLRAWEHDPAWYARDPALTARLDTRFHDMLLAVVRRHGARAPVYVTQDIALSRDPQNGHLAQALASAYQLVPQGLVFRLFPDRDFHEPGAVDVETRGLADGTLRFEADDVVRLKVFPVYVSMLYNRGRYLELHGRHAAAVAAYGQALALDPSFAPAQAAMAAGRAAP